MIYILIIILIFILLIVEVILPYSFNLLFDTPWINENSLLLHFCVTRILLTFDLSPDYERSIEKRLFRICHKISLLVLIEVIDS